MGNVVSSLKNLGTFLKGLVGTLISRNDPVDVHHPLNLGNIQGDVILGLPKRVERFLFFQIKEVSHFRKGLSELVPMITTMKQVLDDRDQINNHKPTGGGTLLPLSGTNIAFSHAGLSKLGLKSDIKDELFKKGQKIEAISLGDPPDPHKATEPDWLPEFKETIDLIILVTGDNKERVEERVNRINKIFALGTETSCLKTVITLDGAVREGKEKGHEHFGYRDGISQPGIEAFGTLNPGQEAVPSGIALCGNHGDPLRHERPVWSLDGSFLVFRYLQQLVPEFDEFCNKNPIVEAGVPPELGPALAGARMVGRWKSGAPIEVTPIKDDPVLADDPKRNNNFDFGGDNQDKCPFAAHIRKANPRADLKTLGGTLIHRIWRQGIPFGPEVTEEEHTHHKTAHSRGLYFVCYQSNIEQGFNFVQKAWSNTETFPPKGLLFKSGFDPIMGLNGRNPRNMFDSKAAGKDLKLPINWVVPKGGEYFFAPSIKALGEELAIKA
jgi:Dyp-type peroxidase family